MIENIAKVSKYNFWNGSIPNLGYERVEYHEKIQHFTGNSLVKVLVGQRRTGKSYLLRQVIQRLINSGIPAQNTFYINKEYIEFDFLSDYKDLALIG